MPPEYRFDVDPATGLFMKTIYELLWLEVIYIEKQNEQEAKRMRICS